jgi:CheY-like chemotaxis protein
MLKVVAVVDDDAALMSQLLDQLKQGGLIGRGFQSREEFLESLECGDEFDALILDWYLDDAESATIAKLLLNDLRERLFVPVLVYTDQKDDAEAEIPNLPPPFNRCGILDKDAVDVAKIPGELAKWYEGSFGARICSVWRSSRKKAFEKSMYELDQLEGEDFLRTLQHILLMDSGPSPDINHALEFLERYVGRKTLADASFKEKLLEELKELLRKQIPKKGDREAALIHAHRYSMPSDNSARTGDIVWVERGEGFEPIVAIVLTPACDLEKKDCFELRLAKAEAVTEGNQGIGECRINAIRVKPRDDYADLVVNFHRTFYVRDTSLGATKTERQGRVIAYDHQFMDVFGGGVRLAPICRLDDPYRSDLLQKFASHASRVGIPDE